MALAIDIKTYVMKYGPAYAETEFLNCILTQAILENILSGSTNNMLSRMEARARI